ncbi:MAG TPA: glycoside hydrolase family 43 protein [Spirochaetia bacterium]|nr:glycoside hydrolase family 43 protein [Spirochaetia bacterium]
MATIENPVLRGFHPDPSIVRDGDDYYLATSTFEWYPGVCIYHSRDLAHWRLVARPLDRLGLLDMRGNPNSGGVWAPCLSYSNDRFYLVYSDVKRWVGQFKDCRNYLTTAPAVIGPWSDPIYLNGSGFDASLFHDVDGRKWLVNMVWDHRPSHSSFAGIALQEFSSETDSLIGEPKLVFEGSTIGLVEGPHLYRRGGYYYLVTAEGGTFNTHAVTVARSKAIEGPYEVMPGNPLLTSAADPSLPLQSAGHASLVETQSGDWIIAYLCRRAVVHGRSVLGRETCLERVAWDLEGWPRLSSGTRVPSLRFEVPVLCRAGVGAQPSPSPANERLVAAHDSVAREGSPDSDCGTAVDEARDDFDEPALRQVYQTLRAPLDESLASLSERPGFLRLKGRESIVSHFRQALVARRISAFRFSASTCVEFEPKDFQQLAGIAAFYSTESFYYLHITSAAHSSKCISLMSCERGSISYPVEKEYPVDGHNRIYLGMDMDYHRLRFRYSLDMELWAPVGWEMDSSILSDEHANPCGFTGAFVALCCQDLSGSGTPADFDYLEYREEAVD